jgi:hypothetical protein
VVALWAGPRSKNFAGMPSPSHSSLLPEQSYSSLHVRNQVPAQSGSQLARETHVFCPWLIFSYTLIMGLWEIGCVWNPRAGILVRRLLRSPFMSDIRGA